MSKRRVLIYAQSLLGLGHIVRATALADALAADSCVRLIGAGTPELTVSAAYPHDWQWLEPLRLDLSKQRFLPFDYEEDYSCLIGFAGSDSAEAVIARRRGLLLQAVSEFNPDVIVTEYFPFSRWVFKAELLPALGYAKRRGAKLVCSIRDVVLPMDIDAEWRTGERREREADFSRHYRRSIDLLNSEFDALFVHSDANLITLGDSVFGTESIAIPVEYTGYLSAALDIATGSEGYDHKELGPYIVVSAGGGYDEHQFLVEWVPAAKAAAVQTIGKHARVIVLTGPLMQEAAYNDLKERFEGDLETTLVRRYCYDFQRLLNGASLSVSRAGYNTAVNVLKSDVPALLVPADHLVDQKVRAMRFSEHDLVVACLGTMSGEERIKRVHVAMRQGRRSRCANVSGARHTAEAIRRLLE